MEASSMYGKEPATYLHDAGHTVSIVNPARIKGMPRLSKMGSARMRKALYMPSLVAMQYNPIIISFSERLRKNGKNGKVIVCAVMRKLVHTIIFGVLKSGKAFGPAFGLKTVWHGKRYLQIESPHGQRIDEDCQGKERAIGSTQRMKQHSHRSYSEVRLVFSTSAKPFGSINALIVWMSASFQCHLGAFSILISISLFLAASTLVILISRIPSFNFVFAFAGCTSVSRRKVLDSLPVG
jgi:hypothetical protein